MQLVQLLLPLYDNDGEPHPASRYGATQAELTGRFGGLTAYTRAPAEGLWREDGARTVRDDIVVVEVMCDGIDHAWWQSFRSRLETRFAQERIVIRSHPIELL